MMLIFLFQLLAFTCSSFNTSICFYFYTNQIILTFFWFMKFKGSVKEIRGTPSKKNQRFVEFYDTRDAAKALMNMNGKEIDGKTVVVEFSRPGGHKNSPKHFRLNPITSPRPQPIILARKFPAESPVYRPPPPPSPPASSHNNSRSSKGMSELGGNGNVVEWYRSSLKKTGKKLPEQSASGGGVWSKQRKGSRQTREKYDPRFLIKEDGIISESSFSDSRTTVMIKNIPNKYRFNSFFINLFS